MSGGAVHQLAVQVHPFSAAVHGPLAPTSAGHFIVSNSAHHLHLHRFLHLHLCCFLHLHLFLQVPLPHLHQHAGALLLAVQMRALLPTVARGCRPWSPSGGRFEGKGEVRPSLANARCDGMARLKASCGGAAQPRARKLTAWPDRG